MWQKISEKVLLDHPRLKVVEDQVRLPSGAITDYVRFAGDSQGVTIVCIVDGQLLVQKEYSYPLDQVLYQLPGGGVHAGEPLEQAARREFAEECQYKAHDLTQIGWFYTNNRRSQSRMNVFLTTDISEDTSFAADAEEDITLHWITLTDIPQMIRDDQIVNHTMLAAWAMWQSHQPTPGQQ